jgi:hypothetical protein
VKYRASNGIVSVILTEVEAREHVESAERVIGVFGETFVIIPLGEFGALLNIAATTYTPIGEQSAQDAPWWTPGSASDEQAARRAGSENQRKRGPTWDGEPARRPASGDQRTRREEPDAGGEGEE